ncbi:ferric reductase-like transmembrane domain-containing protein [Streptomyces rapamycinicus]|uniref:Ferric reductase n=2 Tax=Streptomyces rapamycinicus TaxID=1226757 RepID=A0A3L8QXP4_STRRN|nr:ferric reductase-like transmembrane domain-containing protein [Streptomyces rapamycinicus]MBB4787801.1 ferredoxin-NADP reductase [Streptomyces rapamycinicus]RLV72140.1 ferric reductase [Streptomyces rapamycinicus NRRL 5491]UTP36545.1 ferric reductase-like transmembrane domain-containing protein [Streptomyces rapamycinicus NRRL 5491]
MTSTTPPAPARTRPSRSAPRPPSPVPVLAHVMVWGGAATVLALWWNDTPSVVGAAGWLTGAGRITGLLAGYACAILLLLMARVPLLDRAIGTDRLARWHALGGRYTISLACAHVLLIIWGYALESHTGVVHQTTTLVLHYPDLLKGTIGFLLFLITAIVSARAVRRRIPYETWHLLHFATYLAVFLAFGHQLSDGADFAGDRPAQLAWYALYIAVAALLGWYRFAVPVRRALRHRLYVSEVRPEAPGVVSVYLSGSGLAELRAEPGQFFRWRFLTRGMWWAANPYSLSAAPHPAYLRITVKASGGHSAALARLRPGTRVFAEGPYGAFTARRRRARKTLLLGGGVGITPLRALFETLPGEVILVYRARRPEDLALRGELDALAAARGAAVHYVVDEPAAYSSPLTAGALRALVPDIAERDVYLCGPPGMTEAALCALREAGVRRRRVHHESFAL